MSLDLRAVEPYGRSTKKLLRSDPAWHRIPQTWAMNMGGGSRVLHRIDVAAVPHGAANQHVITVCGTYLTRAAMRFDPPADVDECDTCLMGDTVYHVVYELRSPAGTCVYVGYSAELWDRIHKHRRESAWWTPDLTVTWTTYGSEIKARSAEAAKILELDPTHNLAPNGGGPRTAARKATLHVRPATLTRLVADALGVLTDDLSNSQCAAFLGVNTSTCYRIRNDPDYVVSGSFVAQVMTIFGGIPGDLFEARQSKVPQLAIAA
jgi:hypothetical protein